MVPIFHLPELSVPAAIGVAIVISYLTRQSRSDLAKKEKTEWYESLLEILLVPGASLVFGWIVKQYL
jgi:hypothetical protein